MTRAEILEEEWRYIPGYSKNYMVSNYGRVKTVAHMMTRSNGRPQHFRERIRKQCLDDWGYPMVTVDGKTVKVHRLVALAYLGERIDGQEIRHLDGNPQNNHVDNLKYGTHSENVLDGYTYRGSVRKGQRLSLSDASEIKTMIKSGIPSRRISELYNVSEQTICDIKHGRIYKQVIV